MYSQILSKTLKVLRKGNKIKFLMKIARRALIIVEEKYEIITIPCRGLIIKLIN